MHSASKIQKLRCTTSDLSVMGILLLNTGPLPRHGKSIARCVQVAVSGEE